MMLPIISPKGLVYRQKCTRKRRINPRSLSLPNQQAISVNKHRVRESGSLNPSKKSEEISGSIRNILEFMKGKNKERKKIRSRNERCSVNLYEKQKQERRSLEVRHRTKQEEQQPVVKSKKKREEKPIHVCKDTQYHYQDVLNTKRAKEASRQYSYLREHRRVDKKIIHTESISDFQSGQIHQERARKKKSLVLAGRNIKSLKANQQQLQQKLINLEKQQKNENNNQDIPVRSTLEEHVAFQKNQLLEHTDIHIPLYDTIHRLFTASTFYFRQKKSESHTESEQKVIPTQSQEHEISFPVKDQVEKRIKDYQYLTDFNRNFDAISAYEYTVLYHDDYHQFLYFGYVDVTTKQKSGFGVLMTKKKILEGIWIADQLTEGVQLQKRFLYRGTFRNSKKHGKGESKSTSGQYYLGNWDNNRRQGYGKWSSPTGQTYEGEWKNGKAHGSGIHRNRDGVYEGEFIAFEKHGNGHVKLNNGDLYMGNFNEGIPHQLGTYIWADTLKYQGEFKDGVRSGKGVLVKSGVFQMESTFVNDLPSGICRIKYVNGSSYNGKIQAGKITGFGCLCVVENNEQITGQWFDGRLMERY